MVNEPKFMARICDNNTIIIILQGLNDSDSTDIYNVTNVTLAILKKKVNCCQH